eukprot:573369_1
MGGSETFKVKLIIDGEKKEKGKVQPNWSGNPTTEVIRIYSEHESEDEETKQHYFSAKNLLKLDPKTRVFKFQNEAGEVLILTPVPVAKFSLNYSTLTFSALNETSSEDANVDIVSATEEE